MSKEELERSRVVGHDRDLRFHPPLPATGEARE